jgi:hypothetical protein
LVAGALVAAVALAGAAPCLADNSSSQRRSLTKLSPASAELLKTSAGTRLAQEPSTPTTPGSFFRTRKGALALALVAAGIGYTIWTVHDSRKPVKSPVR